MAKSASVSFGGLKPARWPLRALNVLQQCGSCAIFVFLVDAAFHCFLSVSDMASL